MVVVRGVGGGVGDGEAGGSGDDEFGVVQDYFW